MPPSPYSVKSMASGRCGRNGPGVRLLALEVTEFATDHVSDLSTPERYVRAPIKTPIIVSCAIARVRPPVTLHLFSMTSFSRTSWKMESAVYFSPHLVIAPTFTYTDVHPHAHTHTPPPTEHCTRGTDFQLVT